jgi:hypothetical protein
MSDERSFFHGPTGRERVWKFLHPPTGRWIVMGECDIELFHDEEEAAADQYYEKLVEEWLNQYENQQRRRADATGATP